MNKPDEMMRQCRMAWHRGFQSGWLVSGVIMGIIFLIIIGNFLLVRMPVEAKKTEPILNHRLEVWITALEWCESAGIPEAINPRDRDGTPSYYSFQWKPSTFRQYGERYGLFEKGLSEQQIEALMKNYEMSREIVRRMVDDPKVVWENEFPICIAKKVGLPPR